MATHSSRLTSWLTKPPLILAGLLICHFAIVVGCIRIISPTVDEVAHLPAALTYWDRGTFGLYPHNPPLVRLLFGIPPYLAHPRMYYDGVWRGDKKVERPEFHFGHEFVAVNADRFMTYFALGRIVVAFLSLGTGLILFRWGRELAGPGAGLLAAALYLTDPNMIGHAGLVTVDVGATFFSTLAYFSFWRYLRTPSRARLLMSGIALGLALLAKHSSLLLFPAFLLIHLLHLVGSRSGNYRDLAQISSRMLRSWVVLFCMSVLIINCGYAWEGVGIHVGQFDFVSAQLRGGADPAGIEAQTNRFRVPVLEELPLPLPYFYIVGLDRQANENSKGYPFYFDGFMHERSRWTYYPYCILYKTLLGTLALISGAVFIFLASTPRSPGGGGLAFLLVPLVLLLYLILAVRFQAGFRYLFPVLPCLWLVAGVVWMKAPARPLRIVAALLILSNLVVCLRTFPDFIPFAARV